MEITELTDYTPDTVKAINAKVTELLLKHEDPAKDPTVDPSVDIMNIAAACGIKKVKLVPPDQIDGKHAIYKNGVVKINESDTKGKQLFNLAHEVGHVVFEQITMVIGVKIPHVDSPLFTTEVVYEAAREGTKRKSELPPEKQKIEYFIDRFAANVLVPINRFQLWEDKSDREIAEAFKVEEKCIKKRRQEIGYEIDVLTRDMQPCPAEAVADPDVKLNVKALLRGVA